MRTEPGLFAFVTACIVVSGAVLFGASMLARRASATYAAIFAALAFVFVGGCGVSLVEDAELTGTRASLGLLTFAALLMGVAVQSRCFAWSLLRSFAGIVADLTLALPWYFGLATFEMFATGDGGPGFTQYAPICVLTFLVAEIALPPLVVRVWPTRESVPPRVPTPGEYPR